LMMSLWDALRMNMMISYQELVRTFLRFDLTQLWHRTKPNLTGSSVPNMVIRILRVSLLSVSAGSKSGERAYGSRRCPACKGPEKAF
ncbi:hypothetical protein U4K75_26500, partial [Klebsiella pneumoniae]